MWELPSRVDIERLEGAAIGLDKALWMLRENMFAKIYTGERNTRFND
jgi:hypothetical protein